ncbi:MAG: hypothetical protein H7332_17875 [Bdellovibrionales bacterium]|nr:hypothetical protein [Ramlibacter sp.]
MINWKDHCRASGNHLHISPALAFLAGLLVFGIWHTYPYREISGDRELFLLLNLPGLATMPMLGPTLVSVRPFKDGNEQVNATLAMVGRKTFWTVSIYPCTAQALAFMPLDSF